MGGNAAVGCRGLYGGELTVAADGKHAADGFDGNYAAYGGDGA